MKNFQWKLGLSTLALLAAFPLTTYADSAGAGAPIADGFYFGALGGASYTPSITATGGKIKYQEPSWQAGAFLGYRNGPFRYEVEGLFLRASIHNITTPVTVGGTTVTMQIPGAIPAALGAPAGSTVGLSARTQVIAGLVNGYYDFNTISDSFPVQPYVGIGVGAAQVRYKAKITVTAPGLGTITTPSVTTANNTEFAYQGILGLSYHFDSVTEAFIDYRYFGTTKVNAIGKRFQSHTVNIGLAANFDQDWID